jgi:hypothetical protein
MIREATLEDIPALVEIGAKFHDMSPHRFMGEYDKAGIANMLAYLIGNPGGLVLTNGKGVIGGLLTPVYFAPSKMMCEESFWFAEGGGKDLLRAFETEAERMGADFILLSTLENERAAIIDRVVERMGYRAIERRWLKEIV